MSKRGYYTALTILVVLALAALIGAVVQWISPGPAAETVAPVHSGWNATTADLPGSDAGEPGGSPTGGWDSVAGQGDDAPSGDLNADGVADQGTQPSSWGEESALPAATPEPTQEPTPAPTQEPTPAPTPEPVLKVTDAPTAEPIQSTPEPEAVPARQSGSRDQTAGTSDEAIETGSPEQDAPANVTAEVLDDERLRDFPFLFEDAEFARIPPIDRVYAEIEPSAPDGNASLFHPESKESPHYVDYAFGEVRAKTGAFSVAALDFEVPDYAVAQRAVLRVGYTASDLLRLDQSLLTFSLDGAPFSAMRLSDADGIAYIDVPVDGLAAGYHTLELAATLRKSGTDQDFTVSSEGVFINFTADTGLRVGYREIHDGNSDPALSTYPYPFLSLKDPEGARLSVCVSDDMDNAELAAALRVYADLGERAGDENQIRFGRVSQNQGDQMIFFTLRENMPAIYYNFLDENYEATETLPESIAMAIESGALIYRYRDDRKDRVLVVAEDGAALLAAADFLVDPARVGTVQKDRHTVYAGGASAKASPSRWRTLRDLTGHGARFSGLDFPEAVIPLNGATIMPADFQMLLHYSAGQIDSERSRVAVYWGDALIVKAPVSAGEQSLLVSAPKNLLGATAESLRVVFELYPAQSASTDAPWAYLMADSALFLSNAYGAKTLSTRPAGFMADPSLTVVFTDGADALELLLTARAYSAYAKGAQPTGEFRVKKASEVPAEGLSGSALAVGSALRNTFIQTLNAAMPVPYDESFTQLTTGAGQRAYAAAEIFTTLSGTALVFTAPTEGGLQMLLDLLSDGESIASLQGTATFIDENHMIQTIDP